MTKTDPCGEREEAKFKDGTKKVINIRSTYFSFKYAGWHAIK